MDNYDYEVEGDEEALAQIKELYCRCLVTSRVELENFTTLNIGRMTDGELIELVERKCPRIYEMNKGTKERTQVLLKEFFANVEGLTIAVELASVIMSNGDYSSGDRYVGDLLELQQGCEGPFGSSRV